MKNREIILPERVRQRAEQSGPASKQWVRELPQILDAIEREWSIETGVPLPGGSAAYVAPARTAEGIETVLKVAMPIDDFDAEIGTIIRAKGCGYVKVLRYDQKRRAILQERLGPSMEQLGLPPEDAIVLLGQTLKQAWLVPRQSDQAVTPYTHKAQSLSESITRMWEDLERPCSEQVVAYALELAQRRLAAFDPARCVVVHGDPHPANALEVKSPRAGAESGFVFVDPESFLCEPEYDLGVVLRDWGKQLLAAADPSGLALRFCRILADETGLNEAAIWEWSYIERVSSGLAVLLYGSKELAQPFFETAELLLKVRD